MKNKNNSGGNIYQILIAEDCPTQCEQLTYTLEKYNYRVITAKDGKEALDMIIKHQPSLVISDIAMPLMDGYELCKKLKSNEDTMNIPVILLTSLISSEDFLEGISCGADNFITKPYREDYLISQIEQVLANRKVSKNEMVRVGVEIIFGGKRRSITSTQQQMLTLLISTYEAAVQRNDELIQTQNELKAINDNLEDIVIERTDKLSKEIVIRNRAEERVNKLNRIYAVLSSINKTIVRIRDIGQLFNEVCRIAVDTGMFQSACIGIINGETKQIEITATAGLKNYLIEETPEQDPITIIVRSGKHIVSNHVIKDNDMSEILKQNSLLLGFQSFAAFPLIVFGKVMGGFSIYSNEVDFFDEIEINLLDEMAIDISFALEYIQNELEQKQAQKALYKSEERYKAILQSATDAIVSADIDGIIISWNDAAERIFGYNYSEAIGQPLSLIIPPIHLTEYSYGMQKLKSGEKRRIFGSTIESTGKRKNGEPFPLELSLATWETKSEKYFTGIIRDITQRKLAEEKLIIANKELLFQNEEKEKRAAELIIANKELAFQVEEKGKRADELVIANKELDFQSKEKEKRAAELIIANKELLFQNEEKEKRADELVIANKELDYQSGEKEKRADELVIANKELDFQSEEKGKRADELVIANIELDFQSEEKSKRADELIIANKELVFQNKEKEKRADELIIANNELVYQNEEKEKRAAELIIANKELAFQNEEKEKRAAELIIANKELVFQNKEKEKRANELIIANKELAFQVEEKGKRADELVIANKELDFQSEEKGKRADELVIANIELDYQSEEKGKRADELIIANNELVYQNKEKEKRADELIVANNELVYQNEEKEKRAAELIIANKELAFQNKEKEKRAAELIIANKELAFQNKEKEKRAAELETKVEERTKQLSELNINLKAAKTEAEQANKAKSEFLANMSHEIRTPMNAVLGYSELLDLGLEDKTLKNYVKSIKSSGKSLLTLINDILDLSKIEAGQLELEFDFVDAHAFFSEFERIFSLKISEKGLKFMLDLAPGIPAGIYIDEVRLRQVMLNLIGNAVKFTDKGHIKVKVYPENARHVVFTPEKSEDYIDLVIEIEDTGVGISKEYQEGVFKEFTQERRNKYQEGTGLGLTITKRLLGLMNGTIQLQSKINKGSTFTIKLPGITHIRELEKKFEDIQFDPAWVEFDKATVLIVDDVEHNRKYIADVLKKTNITVVEAEGGKEAYGMAMEKAPDLIITDIHMPKMDGFELLNKIKDNELLKHIPVIAYSASVMKSQKEQIYKSQFAGLLIKPVPVSELLITLMNYLPHKSSKASEPDQHALDKQESEVINDLPGLVHSLETSFTGTLKELETRQPIEEVKGFGKKLEKLGKAHHAETIIQYGSELVNAAESFDIESILKLIKGYQSILKKFKNYQL